MSQIPDPAVSPSAKVEPNDNPARGDGAQTDPRPVVEPALAEAAGGAAVHETAAMEAAGAAPARELRGSRGVPTVDLPVGEAAAQQAAGRQPTAVTVARDAQPAVDPSATVGFDGERRPNEQGTVAFGAAEAPVGEGTVDLVMGEETQAGVEVRQRPADGEGTQRLGRYQFKRKFAEGGLGRLWLVSDDQIEREVVLKEVKPEAMTSPVAIERFLLEAKITGQLEHPGIVPVYELSRRPDGSPYYTMKLVRGRTLAEAIRAYHADPRVPADKRLELDRLLQSYVSLCQAVGYAHDRGVIHRDLKPTNIMVGDYGETQVLDWGLAKFVGQPERLEPDFSTGGLEGELGVRTVAGTGARPATAVSRTLAGQVLGTPAYMPPEQARGDTASVDHLSDIYSLGAILYEILVDRAPFVGAGPREILRQVLKAEPPRPRALGSSVPPALEAVAVKALAKNKAERYQSAMELAAEVQRWIADEPVSAYPEPWWQRTRRWVRRHRTAATAAAAVLVALGTVGGVLYADRVRTIEKLRAMATGVLAEGREELGKRQFEAVQVRVAQSLGAVRGQRPLAELQKQLETLLAESRAALEAESDRRQAADRLRQFRVLADEARVLVRTTEGPEAAENLKQGRENCLQALAMYGAVESADWRAGLAKQPLEAAEQKTLADDLYELTIVLAESEAKLGELSGGAAADRDKSLKQSIQRLQWAEATYGASRALLERRAEYRARLGENELAEADRRQGAETKAATYLDHFLAGEEYRRAGRADEAIRSYQNALKLRADHFWSYYYLGLIHYERKLPEAAVALWTTCVGLNEQFPWIYISRGAAFMDLNDFSAAEADFDRALSLKPEFWGVYLNRGFGYLRRAQAAAAQNRKDEAKRELEKAIADFKRVLASFPDDARADLNLGEASRLKAALDESDDQRRQDYQEAVAHFEEALRKTGGRYLLALVNLGQAYYDQRQYAEALDALGRALAMDPGLLRARLLRGQIFEVRGEPAAALEEYSRAMEINPREPLAPKRRAELHFQGRRWEQAVADYTKAIDLDPNDAWGFERRGQAYAELRRYPEAVSDYGRAVQLAGKGGVPMALYTRRGWAFTLRAYEMAEQDFRRAVELAGDNPAARADAYSGLAYARAQQGRYLEAVEAAKTAESLESKAMEHLYNVACVYAVAAEKAGKDRGQAKAKELAAEYANEAVRLLELAVKTGFPPRAMEADAALDSVREHPGYLALVKKKAG